MKETMVVLRCDWHDDGTEADRTIPFRDGDIRFELDLCKPCRAELRSGARRLKPRMTRVHSAANSNGNAKSNGNGARRRKSREPQASEIREWARGKGFEVSETGRIPVEIVDAFKKAKPVRV